jgi:hypothetical protein
MIFSRPPSFAQIAPACALVLMHWGCTAKAPQFETVDSMPESEPRERLEPVLASPVPTEPDGASLERTAREFFLALSTGDAKTLESLLTESAVLREDHSSSTDPALPALMEISKQLQPGSDSAGSDISWGRAEVEQVSPSGHPATVFVRVSGPEDLRGRWRIDFQTALGEVRVRQVVVPKAK